MKMVGQISIFDLMASDIGEWERFRDKYCNKQMATLKFNEMGEQDKDGKKQKACCYKNEKNARCWDDWQRCTYDNCPFLKGGRR